MLEREAGGRATRRYDLDWLRSMAVLLLIPFHAARIFDVWEPFYVKDAQSSAGLSYLVALMGPWQMPLLFFIAGSAAWFSLGRRDPSRYLAERFRRLLIPFLFGNLVIVPPQGYLARMREPGYAASYLEFVGGYFRDFRDLTGYFGSFTPGHLWFILFLFVISCSVLPLALAWRGEAGRRWLGRLASWVGRPGAILLLAVPLAAMKLLPEAGGKNPFFYWLLFVYGYVLMSEAAWQRAVDRHRRIALAVGAVTSAGLLVIWGSRPGWASSVVGDLLVGLMETVNGWAWVIALVGLAHAHLDVAHPVLRYASEAAYPFYILHQTVLVAVGWFVVRWPVGVALKWALICVVGGGLTLVAYEVLVRRSRLKRFLFGMKPTALKSAAAE
ncbi:acyltransferase family protein [Geochorda subterranea]|uniref:Acyltransferase family protein n=1 Tax=Geochorda subterranea TaxID=3109564 RepID=A0ABZ1BLJ3_9FIRM|nr:acyltransferase family protein [Limnochorda sp. LNt]WRP13691.1 acyltransferase family protein [Limnochorda sp. LNt]